MANEATRYPALAAFMENAAASTVMMAATLFCRYIVVEQKQKTAKNETHDSLPLMGLSTVPQFAIFEVSIFAALQIDS